MKKKKDRHAYYEKRKKVVRQINVSIPIEKYNALEEKLNEKGKKKTTWMMEMVDNEIGA